MLVTKLPLGDGQGTGAQSLPWEGMWKQRAGGKQYGRAGHTGSSGWAPFYIWLGYTEFQVQGPESDDISFPTHRLAASLLFLTEEVGQRAGELNKS